MIQDPPATGSAELNSFLVDVKNAINTATKPLAGWKLSDFEAGVSEVISDKRDLIDIVTAWDDLVNIRSNFETEVARYETLYSDSKVLGNQYQEYANTFSQIMEWWDQNVRLIEDIEAFLIEVNADMSAAASSASAAATSEANAKTSETNAGNSASSASDSATAAASSASAAASSASDAEGAAVRAESVADSAYWQDDRLSVMGQLGPSLKGPPGDKGEPGDGTGDVLWSEINPVLDGKAPVVHNHHGDYYTKGQADGRYVSTSGSATKTGDLNIDNGSVNYIRPDTTGGWARGLSWMDRDETYLAEIGLYGNASVVGYFYIGLGDEPWYQPVFRAYPDFIRITNLDVTGAVMGIEADDVGARPAGDVPWSEISDKPTAYPPESHTHTATQITDATTVGRNVLKATDAAAARGAIGAGTSDLTIGTTSSTAKAGDWKPAAADITDATAIGQSVVKAATTAAARTAIGAGTSNLAIGTTASTAKAGNYTPTVAGVTGLQSALDGKANTSHTHTISQITDMLPLSTSTSHENSIPYRTAGGAIAVPTASITTSGSVTNKAYVDGRTPEIRVVTTMPTSPTPGVVYLKFG